MDEIWVTRIGAIHLIDFGQSGQSSNLDALSIMFERPLCSDFTVLKYIELVKLVSWKGIMPLWKKKINHDLKEKV